MLDKLVEYAQRNETTAPKLYAEGALRYVIRAGPQRGVPQSAAD